MSPVSATMCMCISSSDGGGENYTFHIYIYFLIRKIRIEKKSPLLMDVWSIYTARPYSRNSEFGAREGRERIVNTIVYGQKILRIILCVCAGAYSSVLRRPYSCTPSVFAISYSDFRIRYSVMALLISAFRVRCVACGCELATAR